MEAGPILYLCLATLGLLFAFLVRTSWSLSKKRSDDGRSNRETLSFVGTLLSTVAVGSLFLLHLTWISAGVSQYLGVHTVSVLSALYFLPAALGLVLCSVGIGR